MRNRSLSDASFFVQVSGRIATKLSMNSIMQYSVSHETQLSDAEHMYQYAGCFIKQYETSIKAAPPRTFCVSRSYLFHVRCAIGNCFCFKLIIECLCRFNDFEVHMTSTVRNLSSSDATIVMPQSKHPLRSKGTAVRKRDFVYKRVRFQASSKRMSRTPIAKLACGKYVHARKWNTKAMLIGSSECRLS